MSRDQSAAQDLRLWTVYDHPPDFPDVFLAREWVVGQRGEIEATGGYVMGRTLESLREQLPPRLLRIGPRPADDPAIVETWI